MGIIIGVLMLTLVCLLLV